VLFDALCGGASGYLLKHAPPVKMLESLKGAASDGAPMSSEIAAKVINVFR
jgi:DNA-binding NarL/FixJ family response regulator